MPLDRLKKYKKYSKIRSRSCIQTVQSLYNVYLSLMSIKFKNVKVIFNSPLPSKHITFSKRFILVPVWFRFYKTFYERIKNVIKKLIDGGF